MSKLIHPSVPWVTEGFRELGSAAAFRCLRCKTAVMAHPRMLNGTRFKWVRSRFLKEHRRCEPNDGAAE